MMRRLFALVFLLSFSFIAFSQETGYFFGDFETNSQWLQNDDKLDFQAPKERFRSNNYFNLNYSYGSFTAGLQYEAYLPKALLDYEPSLSGEDGIANYYLKYQDEILDVTVGYFYEQFGSGLILRSYEDRQLGINNALRGVKAVFTPTYYLTLKGVYGKQRYGFDLSEGFIQGLDLNLDLNQMLGLNDWFVEVGGSYVGRYLRSEKTIDTLPNMTNAFAARMDFSKGNFYGGIEYVQLDKKPLVNEGKIENSRLFDGNALQLNLGYAQSGLAIDGTFRRMDNFSFYSDFMAEGNQYNQMLINYVPALTKQQDYLLTNIYVYNAQPRLFFNHQSAFEARSGEVGTQWDVYYTAKRGTALGGKYGTKFAGNFSYWAGLDTEFNFDNNTYKSKFIGNGPLYYRDFNMEIKKRWTKEWSMAVTYMNQLIDESITAGGVPGGDEIKAQVGVVESTYEFGGGRSVRLELQHLWTKEDRKNWAGGMIEYNHNSNLSFYLADSWNYGGEGKLHYYNVGMGYTKGRARLTAGYGRQRGGLLCVGGVCRYVSSNTGANMSLSLSF